MSARHAVVVAAVLTLSACVTGDPAQPPPAAAPEAVDTAEPTTADADPEVTAWAQRVCGGLVEGIAALERLPDADPAEPAAYRDAIDGYLTALDAGFDDMRATLDGAGPPPVDGGDQLFKQGTTQVDGAKTVVGLAKDKLAEVDTSSQAAFQTGFAAVADELRKLVKAGNVVNVLRADPGVDAAFAAAPSCAPLNEAPAQPTS
ncbi:hypothetical protein [Actinokineospora pegani]|uniref:hypothetical protein n=1 Tax=Actinokineospora pegani TaxID=2654637 RepID=UPI0012EA0C2F|nr:hypothetical protein [Actinokineospora pegani]